MGVRAVESNSNFEIPVPTIKITNCFAFLGDLGNLYTVPRGVRMFGVTLW